MTKKRGRIIRFKYLMLQVADVDRSSRFYEDVLGLQCTQQTEGCAWFRANGTQIMLHRAEKNSDPLPPQVAEVWLEVEGIDELAAHLRTAGFNISGPADQPWGERICGVRDPDGYAIFFAETLPE